MPNISQLCNEESNPERNKESEMFSFDIGLEINLPENRDESMTWSEWCEVVVALTEK